MVVSQYKLVANNIPYSGSVILDTFKDEDLLISNNLTEITEVDQIPYSLSRTFQLPGTNKNNSFFQHAYDISIDEPYLFSTNAKVPCYIDYDGLAILDGYLQLNKIVMIDQETVDYWEVTIFGTLNKFARDLNTAFLEDLSSLSIFNHTSSWDNIKTSWNYNLFSGSIVYPFADYGQRLSYTPEENFFGIDSDEGAMTVQDWKPSIRVKEVFDAIFDYAGYTYTSNFFTQSWIDNVYMVLNKGLRYPDYISGSLETFGQFKMAALSGSGLSNVTMSAGTDLVLPWYNVQSNPSGAIGPDLYYTMSASPGAAASRLRGNLKLYFEVKNTGAGNGIPQFSLVYGAGTTTLVNINNYLLDVQTYNSQSTKTEKFTLETEFITAQIATGSTFQFGLRYSNSGGSNFQVVLDPDNDPKSTLEITKVMQAADGRIFNVPYNMPRGTDGIKLIDFIKGIQRKFNLVIYPDKTNLNNFIIEEFNDWYKQGEILNINSYVDLNQGLEVIPANSLAVNKLAFGDKQDSDYVSGQFKSKNNRDYGRSFYTDTTNDFSSGEYNVISTFASAPISYLNGTGLSGSLGTTTIDVLVEDDFAYNENYYCSANGAFYFNSVYRTTVTLRSGGVPITNTYGDFYIPINYDVVGGCGGTNTYTQFFYIPYGSNSTQYEYYRLDYQNCGFTCNATTTTIDCIPTGSISAPPNVDVDIDPFSVISNC
jgi:hypothetical protein